MTEQSSAVPLGPLTREHQALHDIAAELERARFRATAGNGRVATTVTGTGRLVDVEIDPYLEPHHRTRLAVWLRRAIADARADAEAAAEDLTIRLFGGRGRLIANAAHALPWRPLGKADQT